MVGHIANAVAIVLASGAGSPSYSRVKIGVMGSGDGKLDGHSFHTDGLLNTVTIMEAKPRACPFALG